MAGHASLCSALFLTVLYIWCITKSKYQRDWCGSRLIPGIITQSLPSLIIITGLYFEISALAKVEFLRRYWLLISFVAVIAAEYVTRRMFRDWQGLAITVDSKIAQKKVEVADRLENDPRSRTILENALNTYGLAVRTKQALIRQLGNPPTRQQIFRVIETVGLAHIKTLISAR